MPEPDPLAVAIADLFAQHVLGRPSQPSGAYRQAAEALLARTDLVLPAAVYYGLRKDALELADEYDDGRFINGTDVAKDIRDTVWDERATS
jgi:hypothetical protein